METSSRRKFLRNLGLGSIFLLGGDIRRLSAAELSSLKKKTSLRFVVASDAHYGQPDTDFDGMTGKMISEINAFHTRQPLDFCVLNGDLIHNEKSFLPKMKVKADALTMPYYVTRGNHDMVSPEEWTAVWKMPLNRDVSMGTTGIVLGDTSNEKGVYLSPDLTWLQQALDKHKNKKQVFLFLHIPQAKWTANGIDTPAFFELVNRYPNIRAVFHGHEHDQDGVKMNGSIPYLFDSHIGGNWGTDYRGFRVVELMDDGSLVTFIMNPSLKLGELRY